MKCSEMSKALVGTIDLICVDIFEDKSDNTLEQCLDMIEGQVKMIREMEQND